MIALGVFISSLTDNQGFAAGIGIAVILLNYYSVSLSERVSSTAFGSLIAMAVVILLLGFLIRCPKEAVARGYHDHFSTRHPQYFES